MYLDEYEKITISEFNGLWRRGSLDETPRDHATEVMNVVFNKTNSVATRDGARVSIPGLPFSVTKMFLATFSDGNFLLVCDGAGNIFIANSDGSTDLLLNLSGLVDFAALNHFNKCYILPILDRFNNQNHLYVWNETNKSIGTTPVYSFHQAGGKAPVSTMGAATSATAGDVTVGDHEFAYSFITDTGFITKPSPITAYTAPGSFSVDLTGIGSGPAYIVGKQIFATKAGLKDFFYLSQSQGGVLGASTNSATVNFADTDLSVSADDLFDLLETIPGSGADFGGAALLKYNGCMVSTAEGNLVRVSKPGDAESFNNVTGFVQLPEENDGNIGRGGCTNFGVLYLTKAVGIFSVQDNQSGNPSSWPVTAIEGSVGSYQGGIGTITGSQPALPQDSLILMANRQGLFSFNGSIQRPELSWKIRDVWETITHGAESYIQVTIDAFQDLVYVALPVSGSTYPNLLLVGDFSKGLDSQNIRWSIFCFPWPMLCIAMINFIDVEGSADYDYFLRIGSDAAIYKLRSNADSSGSTQSTGCDSGGQSGTDQPINSFWQSAFVYPKDGLGGINIYRAIRLRIHEGFGTLNTSLWAEDEQSFVTLPPFIGIQNSGGKDLTRQTNFMNEKCAIKVSMAGSNYFKLSRVDIFTKNKWQTRPNT